MIFLEFLNFGNDTFHAYTDLNFNLLEKENFMLYILIQCNLPHDTPDDCLNQKSKLKTNAKNIQNLSLQIINYLLATP